MRMSEEEVMDLCKKNNLHIVDDVTTSNPITKPSKRCKKNKFDSKAEENYYMFYVMPRLRNGEILRCEMHREFVILDKNPKYQLKEKRFTPDFILYFADGNVKVVEMKGKIIKKLQRDFQLRKHL